jgi:two-component system, LytTR family, response regulator
VTLRAVIADDEPLARERIRALLEGEPDVQVVRECRDGLETVAAIREEHPDLVFLDVQMPELDGFGVIETIGVENAPVVVFVTAFDEYALQAFEVNAVDYLMKPFDRERFRKALSRARSQVDREKGGELDRRLRALIQELKAPHAYLERVVIKASGRIFFLKTEEIDWIEAAGNYVRLYAGRESHLLRETMNSLEQKLDPNRFIRIHRSTIVRIDRIAELQPLFHGDYLVVLQGGKRLTLSRGYRERLSAILDQA